MFEADVPGFLSHQVPTGQGTGWELSSGGVLVRQHPVGASVQEKQIIKTWGGTTLGRLGFSVAPTENGTKSEVANTDGTWIDYSASPGGAHGGILDGTGGSFVERTTPIVFACRFRTGSAIDSARFFIGLETSGPIGLSDADAIAVGEVGIRHFPAVDSGNWYAWTNVGDSSNYNKQSITAAAANTVYELIFQWIGTTASFWLNGVRADITTAAGFPSGARMDVAAGLYNVHLSAGRSFQFSHLFVTAGTLID